MPHPVTYLPIRHHSPACAWQVDRVIRELRPAVVLVEGPRDASRLIPHLLYPACITPVALFTSFVDRRGEEPVRHGAYYPLCDWSPELAALRAARDIGADSAFIDCTFPELVCVRSPETKDSTVPDPAVPRSLQDDRALARGAWLVEACRLAGARDHDDLWDGLIESGARDRSAKDFFAAVLAWCQACRSELTAQELAADGTLVREAVMRAAIDQAALRGPVVVVTGGLHTVALMAPATTVAGPAPVVKLGKPDDAGVTLMRYGFLQLDRLNGYASGMPAPELQRRRWRGLPVAELLTELARELRTRTGSPSTAEAADATATLARLAGLRGHAQPTRWDLLDAVRSCFISGADDAEGVPVLAAAQKLLTGSAIGQVPAGCGRPHLVTATEAEAERHRLDLASVLERDLDLDLYRSAAHRETSRFLHRLRLLDVPLARCTAGPDWVAGKHLERIRERWRYRWSPATESALIERSVYGATLAEAAVARLAELAAQAERHQKPASRAAALVVEACRCGLHASARDLLARLPPLIAADGDAASQVAACEHLHLLALAQEPLEAHDLPGLAELRATAWRRAAFLLPDLASVADDATDDAIAALLTWASLVDINRPESGVRGPESDDGPGSGARGPGSNAPSILPAGEPPQSEANNLRAEALATLAAKLPGNPVVIGAAWGLRHDDGLVDGAALGTRLAGFLAGSHGDPAVGAGFLRGVLATARSACWREPAVVDALHACLRDLDQDRFIQLLPHLRLAFADLAPTSIDEIAAAAAERCGVTMVKPARDSLNDHWLAVGLRADALVGKLLKGTT